MSLNSSDELFVETLNRISSELNRYFSIIILLFGTIGNLLNCLTLSQRNLRRNPCAYLFLASSIANLITLLSGITVRFLSGWSADLTETIEILCKIRIFILFTSRTIASWLIAFATIDRWFSSSMDVYRRQMSSLNNAKRSIQIAICLSIINFIQIFYCYQANLINSPVKCYGKTNWCRLLIDLQFTFLTVLIPSLLMSTFGLLTIVNIHHSSLRRIQPMTLTKLSHINTNNQRSKRTEHSLLIMLFVQVILLTLFSLPQAIQNLYSNLTLNQNKSIRIRSINNLIYNLFFLLTYLTNGIPFYIYTLTGGTIFRKTLINSFKQICRKFICICYRIL